MEFSVCLGSFKFLNLLIGTEKRHLIAPLLDGLGQVCNKPFLTYPNSGETYNGLTKIWHNDPEQERSLLENSKLWQNQGVRLFGGCCRTQPEDIAQLAKGLKG